MKNNMWLKIASGALAVAIWLFVLSKQQTDVTLTVPVGFSNVPSGMVVVKPTTAPVTSITVRGHERFLKNLSQSSISVGIDLSKAKKGIGIYTMDRSTVDLPPLIQIIALSPASFTLTLEKTIRKTVRVRASMKGIPMEGFVVSHIEVKPKRLVVEGIKSRLKKIKSLTTEPIDITNASAPVAQEAAVINPAEDALGLDIDTVNVKVVIVKR